MNFVFSLFFLIIPLQYVELKVLSIHDGDTIKADVILPLGVVLANETIRFDYDAWEVGARTGKKITEAEKKKGQKARQDLVDLFEKSDTILGKPFTKTKRDSFGRLLLKPVVVKDGIETDVNQFMHEHGNVRED